MFQWIFDLEKFSRPNFHSKSDHTSKNYTQNATKDVKKSYEEQDDENLDMWIDVLIKG